MHVLQLRGGLVEATHPVSVVVAERAAGGPRLRRLGEAVHTFWRSASKPFQLGVALEQLPRGGAALPDTALAIGASSHSGQPAHQAEVRRALAAAGLDEAHLRCGAEPPAHRETAARLIAEGSAPQAIHNDCSGKHALMLTACAAQGWSLEGYLEPEHPLQRAIAAKIHARTAERPPTAVDGCGVPTFWVSLEGMARAWLQLAEATADPRGEPLLHRIGQAMMAHPFLVSGDGRIDLAVAERAAEPFIGKIGALGVFCVALPARGAALALKVHSGDEAALAMAVPAALERFFPGCLRATEAWPWRPVHNVAGRIVGHRLVTRAAGV